jgi:hypothetical protein
MQTIPLYVSVVFALTTALAIYFFYNASHRSRTVLAVLVAWTLLQAMVSLTGFYTVNNSLPPRFVLLVLPPLLLMIALFATTKGRSFIDHLRRDQLTLLHVVRVPVEIVLFWLFVHKAVPEVMTFEGRNFDILAGITAPLVYYFGFRKRKLNRALIVAWNIICLGLLMNIVITAILAAPTPLQKIAFDQPNIGVLYFPFTWLPGLIVPLVLFSHLVCLRKLANDR